MKKIRNELKIYKELKADIEYYSIKLKELEGEILGVQAQPTGEHTQSTNKFNSVVESQAEELIKKKERYIKKIERLKERVGIIDNALSILTEEERDIVVGIIIEQKRYAQYQMKYYVGYSAIKKKETIALKRIEKYFK